MQRLFIGRTLSPSSSTSTLGDSETKNKSIINDLNRKTNTLEQD